MLPIGKEQDEHRYRDEYDVLRHEPRDGAHLHDFPDKGVESPERAHDERKRGERAAHREEDDKREEAERRGDLSCPAEALVEEHDAEDHVHDGVQVEGHAEVQVHPARYARDIAIPAGEHQRAAQEQRQGSFWRAENLDELPRLAPDGNEEGKEDDGPEEAPADNHVVGGEREAAEIKRIESPDGKGGDGRPEAFFLLSHFTLTQQDNGIAIVLPGRGSGKG